MSTEKDFNILFLSVLCVLISKILSRYAYSEETGDDFEEEGVSLTGSGNVMVASDLATKVERKERKTSTSVEPIVFGLGEDLEEDKRE